MEWLERELIFVSYLCESCVIFVLQKKASNLQIEEIVRKTSEEALDAAIDETKAGKKIFFSFYFVVVEGDCKIVICLFIAPIQEPEQQAAQVEEAPAADETEQEIASDVQAEPAPAMQGVAVLS